MYVRTYVCMYVFMYVCMYVCVCARMRCVSMCVNFSLLSKEKFKGKMGQLQSKSSQADSICLGHQRCLFPPIQAAIITAGNLWG